MPCAVPNVSSPPRFGWSAFFTPCSSTQDVASANLVASGRLTSPALGELCRAVAGRRGDYRGRWASRPRSTRSSRKIWCRCPWMFEIPTYNIDPTWSPNLALSSRTRAIMIAHTLGNPFDLNGETARRARAATPWR